MEETSDTAQASAKEVYAPEKEEGGDSVDLTRAEGGGEEEEKKCCRGLRFKANQEAQGYSLIMVARGGIVMSNIFLSTALIRLGYESAGCTFEDDDTGAECDVRAYGFRPSSLITMIAVVAGLLSACLLPIIGAIVDYTSHRRLVGICSVVFITVVQAVQIWLTTSTWFFMAILQALTGFMYMVLLVTAQAYLPDIGREVGSKNMISFTTIFSMIQFGSEFTFIVLILGVSMALVSGDVATAQVSQGICVVWVILTCVPGWRKMRFVPALHERTDGKSLVRLGFSRNWQTVVGINKHYGSGLRWYFLAVVFAEAGANAFTVIAVTFMIEVLDMTADQLGMVFLVTQLFSLPGAKIGELISQKTNPITSWKINLAAFSIITAVGSFVLTSPEDQFICYVFGALWGVMLGWFWPLESAIFALTVPSGQESELAGFYTYCCTILAWLPPLIVTVLNESGFHMKWGIFSIVIFLLIGLAFSQLMAPWEDLLARAKHGNKMILIAAS